MIETYLEVFHANFIVILSLLTFTKIIIRNVAVIVTSKLGYKVSFTVSFLDLLTL